MIRMEGGDRMRVTLLDRMSTVENGRSSMTLEDVLMAEMNSSRPLQQPSLSLSPARNHRILFDVIRRDRRRDKTTWRSLRDKLRLKRSSISNATSSDSDRHRLGFLLSISESTSGGGGNGGGVEREVREESVVQQPRMSLMELLEDADEGQMYDVVTTTEEAVTERRGEETVTTTVEMGGCCVCMMRSKGAAFIPCGHTFCRLCSRQLWVQRGNCPLCNTSILQVLDLF